MHPENQIHIDRLTELGLLEQFQSNCDKYGDSYEITINNPETTFSDLIYGALVWDPTSEGWYFWNAVANGHYKPRKEQK